MHDVLIRKFEDVEDPRLKRIVQHDSRSLDYLAPVIGSTGFVSTKFSSRCGAFDQGQIGSCTGNAMVKSTTYQEEFWEIVKSVLSTTDAKANEKVAQSVYSDAEVIDGGKGLPTEDEGSSGLSVAKVALKRGWISGYTHATSLDAVLTALQTQAIITGVSWYDGMYNPTSKGELVPTGKVVGGHEFVLFGCDVDLKRIWMQNSWSDSWGPYGDGTAWLSYDAYSSLLADQGDATVMVPVTKPAPVPIPDQNPIDAFETAAKVFLSHKHTSVNVKQLETPLRNYLAYINEA